MRAIAILIVILMILFYADAGMTQCGYIGLFTDANHDTWCVSGTGFYQIEMWIWCFPGNNGQMGAEYGIAYPANVITSTITINEEIVSDISGNLWEGVTVWYYECQYDWNWNIHQKLYVTDQTKTKCQIVVNPNSDSYQFASCLEGYPFEPCSALTYLYLNYYNYEPECSG